MTTYDIALIGFGGVNRTLAELIATRGERLRSELGFGLRIVAITDLRLGSLVQPEGVDLSVALKLGGEENETFAAHGGSADTNNESVIRNCTADIICEATFTNPEDGEPAVSHVRWALESGKSVCTTNKGPVALRGAELSSLAEQNGVHFEFEGAVMSGTPVIRLAKKMFAGLKLNGFEGISTAPATMCSGDGSRPGLRRGHQGGAGTRLRRSKPRSRHRGLRRSAQGPHPRQRAARTPA